MNKMVKEVEVLSIKSQKKKNNVLARQQKAE